MNVQRKSIIWVSLGNGIKPLVKVRLNSLSLREYLQDLIIGEEVYVGRAVSWLPGTCNLPDTSESGPAGYTCSSF